MSGFSAAGYFKGKENFQSALEYLIGFTRNLTWMERDGKWILFAGEPVLFKGDTKEEMEAFILGMAITLATLSDEIKDQIMDYYKE